MQGWHTWLSDLQQLLVHGDDAVLVTLAATDGNAARETGVKMIVARDRAFHTIGGGPLEWRAIEIGRVLLRDTSPGVARHLERIAPEEPYGGVTTLAFERLTIADLGWVSALGKRFSAGEASVRTVSFADASPVLLSDAEPASAPDCLLWDAGPLLSETIVLAPFPVLLFGAGHVGAALVRLLATLPCQVRWIDDRPAQLATRIGDGLPANVVADVCDDPPACVASAPPQSSFVIATYSDALDQVLAERVLRRGDQAYLGVIGSHAKRHAMEHLFAARGIDPLQVGRMHCPIGIDAVRGSAPEIIAVSVAAQLLQVREQRHRHDVQPSIARGPAYDPAHAASGRPEFYRTPAPSPRSEWRD
ncbi:MAG: xanthine dehydrogenase accessory protein XdhC [Janthinobacterium lividum]